VTTELAAFAMPLMVPAQRIRLIREYRNDFVAFVKSATPMAVRGNEKYVSWPVRPGCNGAAG
jgi:hypothetical protein